jgi:hypothetical protein
MDGEHPSLWHVEILQTIGQWQAEFPEPSYFGERSELSAGKI